MRRACPARELAGGTLKCAHSVSPGVRIALCVRASGIYQDIRMPADEKTRSLLPEYRTTTKIIKIGKIREFYLR
jgi:hypothetical protein